MDKLIKVVDALASIEKSPDIISVELDYFGTRKIHLLHSYFMRFFACDNDIQEKQFSDEYDYIFVEINGVEVYTLRERKYVCSSCINRLVEKEMEREKEFGK